MKKLEPFELSPEFRAYTASHLKDVMHLKDQTGTESLCGIESENLVDTMSQATCITCMMISCNGLANRFNKLRGLTD